MTMVIDRVETFNDWLQDKKQSLGLEFNYQLADKLGISPDQLSKIMMNRASPTALHIKAIFDNLQIEPASPEGAAILQLYWQTRYAVESNHQVRGKYTRPPKD